MHPMIMSSMRRKLSAFLFLAWVLLGADLPAQHEQEAQSGEKSAYGSGFFDQLHRIFGKFREADLQHVFQEARPIGCSELVGRKGEWRTVAFFNENRELGNWCRESLEEVKTDLAIYTFTGVCSGDKGTIQVATEFPTAASIEAYNHGEIDLNKIDITVNDPVNASLNPRTMAYTFDLPYLFLTGRQGSTNVYSLVAPDRDAAYAGHVASHWECKAVSSEDVTYRFIICRVVTVPKGTLARNQTWEPSFGSSAFSILSDGTEAKTSVNLSFGEGIQASEKPADTTPTPTSSERPSLKRPEKANSPAD